MSDLTLYTLVGSADEQASNISPHVWKTKIDLAILGLTCKEKGQSFYQIHHELYQKLGKEKKVLVPVLEVDGEHVVDSWDIAEYLESKYAKNGKSLFGGSEAGRNYAKFIDIWVNTTLASELRPLIAPKVYERLDTPSQEYFKNIKNDPTKFTTLQSKLSDPQHIATQTSNAKARLQVIEDLLKYNDGGYLGGKEPGHADGCVFGWYAFSRVNRDVVDGVWEDEGFPFVRDWLERMKELIDEKELL